MLAPSLVEVPRPSSSIATRLLHNSVICLQPNLDGFDLQEAKWGVGRRNAHLPACGAYSVPGMQRLGGIVSKLALIELFVVCVHTSGSWTRLKTVSQR